MLMCIKCAFKQKIVSSHTYIPKISGLHCTQLGEKFSFWLISRCNASCLVSMTDLLNNWLELLTPSLPYTFGIWCLLTVDGIGTVCTQAFSCNFKPFKQATFHCPHTCSSLKFHDLWFKIIRNPSFGKILICLRVVYFSLIYFFTIPPEKIFYDVKFGRFRRHDLVACDMVTTSPRYQWFRAQDM